MRQPDCVIWALTKHQSAFKRQNKGAKSRNECFSTDPLSLTSLHNASGNGLHEKSIGLVAVKGESKSQKGFKRDYVLRIAHKSRHNTTKVSKSASAGLHYSTQTLSRGSNAAAKSIQGLTFANNAKKQLLLRKLGRLHSSTRDLVKNAPGAKK